MGQVRRGRQLTGNADSGEGAAAFKKMLAAKVDLSRVREPIELAIAELRCALEEAGRLLSDVGLHNDLLATGRGLMFTIELTGGEGRAQYWEFVPLAEQDAIAVERDRQAVATLPVTAVGVDEVLGYLAQWLGASLPDDPLMVLQKESVAAAELSAPSGSARFN